jgi:5-methylcytosine-specific restriction protein B
LRLNRCVLIKGVPASGKTRLLGEVSRIFTTQGTGRVGTSTRALVPAGGAGGASAYLPSPDRTDRIALSLVMNQNTRYRDVWRAPEPKVDGSAGFQLSKGALYRANEHAKTQAGTALVAIDELNRGPAVNVFGPSIVAIEADKRSDDDNQVIDGQTRTFELPTDTGGYEDYWLSAHLYILCAQNNADTSVEAIDTAFLRRFTPIELLPNEQVLIQHFGLDSLDGELPETATDAKDLYRAAVRAWRNVNRKLSVGASPDFQIGHGALMNPNESVPDSNMDEALDYVRRGWARIDQHVAEVFYGKPDQIASALWVDEVEGHPYRIVTVAFADLDQVVLDRTDSDLYLLLRAIASAP